MASTLKSSIRRGFLRQIGNQAAASAITLWEALNTFQAGVFSESFKSGRVYLSTSGSGQAASFISVSGFFLGSQGEVFSMAEEFLNLYTIVTANDSTLNTDALILQAMLDDNSMAGVTMASNDWTLLDFPQTGVGLNS